MSGSYTDYLDPLPTTLDAKNSPLALLAQTCYNISKDDSAKSLIPPIERKKDGRDSSKSTSPLAENSQLLASKSPPKLSSAVKTSDSGISKLSPKDKHCPEKTGPKKAESPPSRINAHGGQELKSTVSGSSNSVYSSLSVDTNHKDSLSHGASAHQRPNSSSPATADGPPSGVGSLPSSSKLPLGPYGHTGLLSPYYPGLTLPMYPGYPHLANPASLLGAAAGESDPKPEPGKHVTVTHASVKTISGATTLVPVCADPYCSQCRLSVQAAQYAPSCPPGIPDSPRDGGHRSSSASSSIPGLPHPALAALHPLARLHPSLFPGSPLELRSGQHSPPATNQHLCSWVANGKYCGERFSTSEELMSHLRSHTSSLEPPVGLPSGSSLPSAFSSLTHPSLALSHLYGLPATPLGSLSSTSPARTGSYGRSLSPTSLLSSSRFHPYMKSPLSHIPSSLPSGFPSIPPSLGSLPSLYPLPGTRMAPLVP